MMADTTRVLIQAFEPFGAYRRNITQTIAAALPLQAGWCVRVLPVRFDETVFRAPLETLKPRWILGLGQCPRGERLRIERRAFNQMRDRSQGLENVIDPSGPEYMAPNWRLSPNHWARDSYDAGRYVCNYSMYFYSRLAAEYGYQYAFVHIPRDFALQRAITQILRLLRQGGAY
ncbi:MAG: hypothetical protein ACO1RX_09305 [Candidatus Sericytochromatia bacterium]